MPLQKPLESIEEADLLQLIKDKVVERRTIEYRQSLHGNSDGEIKEFLADVENQQHHCNGGDAERGLWTAGG